MIPMRPQTGQLLPQRSLQRLPQAALEMQHAAASWFHILMPTHHGHKSAEGAPPVACGLLVWLEEAWPGEASADVA